MDSFNRRSLLALSAGLAASPGAPRAQAAWPDRPVRIICAFPGGSTPDLAARAIAPHLQQVLGQPVIVENRLGASGTIAVGAMLAAPPDGHTVSVYTAAHTVVPLLSKVPYDPLKDISAVIPLAVVPNVLVVAPSKGFKTVQDLVAAAKAKPGFASQKAAVDLQNAKNAKVLAETAPRNRALWARLDGPYGGPGVQLHFYTSVLLVAGGVGIAPFYSVAKYSSWLSK
jgi:tripartite-type tricarboxylate transporter receptor subunit TctC